MARSPHQNTTAPAMLPLTVVVLVITSLLPARFSTPWVSVLGDQADVVFAPPARVFTLVGQLFTRPSFNSTEIDPKTAKAMIDDLQARNRQLDSMNTALRRRLDEISNGQFLLPQNPIKLLLRPVIEPGGRLMRVRGGTGDGISRNSIATAGLTQLVGRVESVESRTSVIQPITASDAPKINARVLRNPGETAGLACLLTSMGDGTLTGPITVNTAQGQSNTVEVGQTVVLNDDQWPTHAQMLVVGLVESVADHPTTSTRKIVTVRPTVSVRRVAEIYLRVPTAGSANGSAGEGSP